MQDQNLLARIRTAFADYRQAEGCICCRDKEAHEQAESRLAQLLNPEPYEDGSGWDWSKYRTGSEFASTPSESNVDSAADWANRIALKNHSL